MTSPKLPNFQAAPRDYEGPKSVAFPETPAPPSSCREDWRYTETFVDRFLGQDEGFVPDPPGVPTEVPPSPPRETAESAPKEKNPGLAERQEKFFRSLRKIRARGAHAVSWRAVVAGERLPASVLSWLKGGLPDGQKFGAYRFLLDDTLLIKLKEVQPDRFLEEQAEFLLERDEALLVRREKKIKVVTVSLHVEERRDGMRVRLKDWMTDRFFFAKTYPRGEAGTPAPPGLAADLARALRNHERGHPFRRSWRRLEALNPEERRELRNSELFRVAPALPESRRERFEAQRSWRRLLRNFRVTLEAVPFRKDIDRGEDRNGILQRPLSLSLDRRRMRKIRFRPLEVGGFLTSIRLEPENLRRGRRWGRQAELQIPASDFHRDRYGNALLPLPGEEILTGKSVFMGFGIVPRFPLAERAAGAGAARLLGFDLTDFGFGDHRGILSGRPLLPVFSATPSRPYRLYSTLPAGFEAGSKVYESAARRARAVEGSFGLRPGEKIKNVFLVPSEKQNASVHVANPETIFLWDEIFPQIAAGDADHIVDHEAYHSLDMQLHFSTHPGFARIFNALRDAHDLELFSAVDERNFLEKMGGHSEDDAFEFFASLLNTVSAPAWEEKIGEMCPRTRGLYYHALRALRAALLARRPELRDAPIGTSIGRRLAFLESQAGAAGFPPFEELAMLPAGAILQRGPRAVEVLSAKDFAEALALTREPLAVFVFHNSSREAVPFVQNLSGRWGEKVRFLAVNYDLIHGTKLADYFGPYVGAPELVVFRKEKLLYRGELFNAKARRETERSFGELFSARLD